MFSGPVATEIDPLMERTTRMSTQIKEASHYVSLYPLFNLVFP